MTISIERREFLEIFGGSTTLIGVDSRYESGPVFVMYQFLLENGEQLGRLHTYLRDGLLPALAKTAGGAQIVLEAVVAAHSPQVVFLQEFKSVDAWRDASIELRKDAALREANKVWDHQGPYLSHSVTLMSGTNYCPPVQGVASGQRIFEMRIYQAASEWQLNGVHERFEGPEIPIFHRCGIEPLLYATTIAGPQMPNMTYFTPFESLAAREVAWAKFQADPEWIRVKQQSLESHGYTPRVITISLFKAAAYSPVK